MGLGSIARGHGVNSSVPLGEDAVAVSARNGPGFGVLLGGGRVLPLDPVPGALRFPEGEGAPIHMLYERGRVMKVTLDERDLRSGGGNARSLRRSLEPFALAGFCGRGDPALFGMNVPNALTLLRIFFGPLLVASLLVRCGFHGGGRFRNPHDSSRWLFSWWRRGPICWMDSWRGAGNRSRPSARCWIRLPTSCSSRRP